MKTDNRKLFEYSLTKFNEVGWVFEELSLDLHQDKEDIITTKRIIDAGKLLGVSLNDHIIIGQNSYVSLRAEGHIRF